MTSRTRRLVLVGFGRVGQAFARLLRDRRADLAARYGLELQVAAIATGHAAWRAGGGEYSLERLLEQVDRGASLADVSCVEPGWQGARVIEEIDADLLVEATPTRLEHGEPGATHLRLALARGWDVVAASKGALVHHYAELRDLARGHGATLRFGGATAAALPTVDLAQYCLAAATITRVEGVLNGTTNFILSEMAHGGLEYAHALAEAQRRGIAEPDPRLDVEGWDTAAKLVLLANAVLDAGLRLGNVDVQGITRVTRADAAQARARGEPIRLLGRLWWDEGRLRADVAPRPLAADHPLAPIEGTEKGATFWTDPLGRISVVGGKSDPVGTAGAILRDIVHLPPRG